MTGVKPDAMYRPMLLRFWLDVRENGDAAVKAMTALFDGFDLDAVGWQIPLDICRAALEGLAPELRQALELAAARIRTYHEAQRPQDSDAMDDAGVRMGARWRAVRCGGDLCPRRSGRLSVVRPDECHSGQGCRRRAACDGYAFTRWSDQSVGPCSRCPFRRG
jgi:hypothetical protein